jgi:hypothetical protein
MDKNLNLLKAKLALSTSGTPATNPRPDRTLQQGIVQDKRDRVLD